MTVGLGYSKSLIAIFVFFLLLFSIQISLKKYIPVFYWLVIVGTTTLGTEVSDFLDRTLHMGYAWGSFLLASCLALTLLIWYKKYRNLEVYPIFDRTKEIFYWIAIFFSNSLGTAFGDFLSDNIGLSFLNGAI